MGEIVNIYFVRKGLVCIQYNVYTIVLYAHGTVLKCTLHTSQGFHRINNCLWGGKPLILRFVLNLSIELLNSRSLE